jgi:hypothetical protein
MIVRHDAATRSIRVEEDGKTERLNLDQAEKRRNDHNRAFQRAIQGLKSQIKREALKSARTRKTTEPDESLEQGRRLPTAAGEKQKAPRVLTEVIQ